MNGPHNLEQIDLPILTDDMLRKFAAENRTAPVIPVRTGRFAVPVPDLKDGGGPLQLPNAKELPHLVRSGDLGAEIKAAKLEGFPQIYRRTGPR
jgi:hypothetical protein